MKKKEIEKMIALMAQCIQESGPLPVLRSVRTLTYEHLTCPEHAQEAACILSEAIARIGVLAAEDDAVTRSITAAFHRGR